MTTGYTEIIEKKEDLTLEEFALRCAGIEMHSDRQELNVSYHQRNLEDIAKKLIDVSQMTHVEIECEAELRLWWMKKRYDEAMARYEKLQARYKRMRTKVEDWTPPTSEHVNLKKLMLEQIDSSIPNDPKSHYPETVHVHVDPKEAMIGFDHEEWRLSQYEQLLEEMKYHLEKQVLLEKERAKHELWIQKLRESLKGR